MSGAKVGRERGTHSQKNIETFSFRFAKNKLVSSENYVTVMIRLHLAHGMKEGNFHKLISSIYLPERFHSIDTKMKGNPLSLEEMILMTIYS